MIYLVVWRRPSFRRVGNALLSSRLLHMPISSYNGTRGYQGACQRITWVPRVFHQAPNGQKQPYLSLLFTVATAIMMTPLLVFWLLDTKAKGPWWHPWFVMTKTCWVQGRSLQIIPEGSENDDREERRIRQELICISCIQAWAITIVLKSLQKKSVCRTLVEWWTGSL